MWNSCKATLEKDRYPHFITAANQALDMLKQTEPPANTLDILFHHNDHKDIYWDHGIPAVQSQRQPDIIVTSLQSVRRAGTPMKNASDSTTWNTISLEHTTKKPISCFQWMMLSLLLKWKAAARKFCPRMLIT